MACSNWFNCTDEKRKNLTWWQLLQLLVTGDGSADDCPALRVKGTVTATVTPSSTVRTPTRVLKTAGSQTAAAGARSVTLETSDDFTGTILGVIAQPNRVYPFEVKQNDDTLAAIAYVITTGTVIEGRLV